MHELLAHTSACQKEGGDAYRRLSADVDGYDVLVEEARDVLESEAAGHGWGPRDREARKGVDRRKARWSHVEQSCISHDLRDRMR